LRADFGTDAARPKSEGTAINMRHIVRDYLTPRFGREIAEDIKPLDIQRWLKSLRTEKKLSWTTISKIRGVMLRVYKTGILHELISKNPVQPVESRSTTNYRAIILSPEETQAVLKALPHPLHRILVLTCAATALRASELLALRWADIRFGEGQIRVSKRWSRGKDGPTKTAGSEGTVPLHPILARAQPLRRRDGFRVSVAQGFRESPTQRRYFCRRSSAHRRQKSGLIHPGRAPVRSSLPPPFAQLVPGGHCQGRSEDDAGISASCEGADYPAALHAGQWR
jgi:integrase